MTVAVLALQGAFVEHENVLKRRLYRASPGKRPGNTL